YRSFFGHDVPAHAQLDFATEGVIFYSAGLQDHRQGGWWASIKKVSLSRTGRTLKIVTALEAPAEDCSASPEMTVRPYDLRRFTKPPRPTEFTRFYREDTVRPCDADYPSPTGSDGCSRTDVFLGCAPCVTLKCPRGYLCAVDWDSIPECMPK